MTRGRVRPSEELPGDDEAPVADADYRALAQFRYEIRRFLRFSEDAARAAQIEPQQHQLLLSLRGLRADVRPTIAALAERLCVTHQSTVALVDKVEARGFVVRERGAQDRREVHVHLTDLGRALLRNLSAMHRDQLRKDGPRMVAALLTVLDGGDTRDLTDPAPLALFTKRPRHGGRRAMEARVRSAG